ncbi:unnamed protein product [Ostreobium quekettii]|uniref:Uncharacterized protein n=1 Tax=Ostreobium quekettii TaxID=121088 RepID=A0A8S1JG93_9CHLO|nr:unnamed protein product [Ostreobium quekettii]
MLRRGLAAALSRALALDAARPLSALAHTLPCPCGAQTQSQSPRTNPQCPESPPNAHGSSESAKNGKERRKATKPLIPGPNDVVRPEPGSVDRYHSHVLVRVPIDARIRSKEGRGFGKGGWAWPPVVEALAPVTAAFVAIARFGREVAAGIKVTAYEPVEADGVVLERNECELIIFPEAIEYQKLPISLLRNALTVHLFPPSSLSEHEHLSAPLPDGRQLEAVHILVCCHGSRDRRCASMGPPLAQKLHDLVVENEWEKRIRVLRVSHVGGSQVALHKSC